MKKMTSRLVTTFNDIGRVQFSDEFIRSIVENQPVVPLTANYGKEILGSACCFTTDEDGVLNCQIEIYEDLPEELMRAAKDVLPAIEGPLVELRGNIRIIESGDLTEVSISTLTPRELHNPIKLEETK